MKPQKNYSLSHESLTSFLILTLVLMLVLPTASGQTLNYAEVGASSDNGSSMNLGARAQIRTNIYNVARGDVDSFYIGDVFNDGTRIIFGYTESYSVKPQWFWAFGFTPEGFTIHLGSVDSGLLGLNGTWHDYEIAFTNQYWTFNLDGVPVDALTIATPQNSESVYFAGQKATPSGTWQNFGVVEFRNLTYLKNDGWHQVDSLHVTVSCLAINPLNESNGIPGSIEVPCSTSSLPYGVLEVGENHVLIGSGMPKHTSGDELWSTNAFGFLGPVILTTQVVLFGWLAVATIVVVVIIFSVLLRKRGTGKVQQGQTTDLGS